MPRGSDLTCEIAQARDATQIRCSRRGGRCVIYHECSCAARARIDQIRAAI
jgi:hypothetical protein